MLERLKQLAPLASATLPKSRKPVAPKKKTRNLIKVSREHQRGKGNLLSCFVTMYFAKMKHFCTGADKKFEPIEREVKYILPKTSSLSSLKKWDGEPGFEIRDPEKTYPGSGFGGQKSPDPQHCFNATEENSRIRTPT
jgi:hypothetical protein